MADWNAIEKAYREDKMSNVKLAAAHNVTEGAIRKEAKKGGWVRGSVYVPPAAKLPPVPAALMRRPPPAERPPLNEAETALLDDLVLRMLDELDATTSHVGEIEALIDAETAGDKDGRRRAAMLKAVSLPVRANTLRLLLTAQAERAKKPEKGKKAQKAEAAKEAAASSKFRPRIVA